MKIHCRFWSEGVQTEEKHAGLFTYTYA